MIEGLISAELALDPPAQPMAAVPTGVPVTMAAVADAYVSAAAAASRSPWGKFVVPSIRLPSDAAVSEGKK